MTDRALTSTVGYVLTVAIAAVLVAGLVVAAGGAATDQRERTAREAATVVGHRVAATLETADRTVAAAAETRTLTVERDLPDRLVGASYSVTVEDAGGDTTVVVRPAAADVTVRVGADVDRPVADPGAVDGGTVVVAYDPGDDELEVRDG